MSDSQASFPFFRNPSDSYLLLFVLNGQGTLSYQGNLYNLSANNGMLIDCHEAYSHYAKEPWEIIWFHFNGARIHSLIDTICSNTNMPFYFKRKSEIADILNSLVKKAASNTLSTSLYFSTLLYSLLRICLDGSNSSTNRSLITDINTYINLNPSVSIEHLAAHFHYSSPTLSRLYQKYNHTGLYEAILASRISYAKQQLRFSDLSLNQIMINAGFKSKSTFHRQFKKYENCTPIEYKKAGASLYEIGLSPVSFHTWNLQGKCIVQPVASLLNSAKTSIFPLIILFEFGKIKYSSYIARPCHLIPS